MTEQLPDIERLEEGHEVTVYYQSQRSGNEVDRTGTVTAVLDTEGGDRVVRLHTEDKGQFKDQYVALLESTLETGDDIVAAFSVTAEAETDMDDPPKIGRTYTLKLTIARTSFLGEVDRVVREDGPGPFLVTDGGTPRKCDNPRCDRRVGKSPVLGANEVYCCWTCAALARRAV